MEKITKTFHEAKKILYRLILAKIAKKNDNEIDFTHMKKRLTAGIFF